MKLQHITTTWFVAALILLISIWATVFYFAILDEIYDSIDDGLDNQKQLIIARAAADSSILAHADFGESGYAIRLTTPEAGRNAYDRYTDTSMYMQNEDDYEPVRLLTTVFRQGAHFYELQVATSMVEEDDLLKELLYSLLWLFLGLVLSLVLLNKLLLGRIWKPFYALMGGLRKYRIDQQEDIGRVKTRIDEFNLLQENIDALLKRARDAYKSQKQFLENASHELQTPLAISINKLEALAESGQLSEPSLQLLGSALDNLERMTRLNRSLLLLSRIENRQFANKEIVVLNDLVKKLAEDFSDQLEFRNITLTIEETQPCTVQMHPDLALIVLTNLVKNAIVHNHTGGQILIRLAEGQLSISNTGRAAALDAGAVFARFSKQDPSSASTGLGMAIVKAITDLYGHSIQYSFTGEHVFTLRFS